ncbi:uncharacterized protein LOC143426191 [Xylocopa sonorina]|uniref:uncharacterized protein LOC143426191 n=1 Tax=Xylocopa sonorina TaxID=1818115 RepID=UPI00403AD9AA
MIGRTSLVEQKRIQWAREREEMARLGGSWGFLKNNINIRTNIRTYPNGPSKSLVETKDKQSGTPFRAVGNYGSTVSLKSLTTENSRNSDVSLKCLDCNGGSMINLLVQSDVSQIRHRSPSLPPIYSKDQQRYLCQGQQRDFAAEGMHYHSEKLHRLYDCYENSKQNQYGSQGEEREGETSGYASDSVDAPVSAIGSKLSCCKPSGAEMSEKTWSNPYHATPESSLPPSRRLSDGRIGDLNRPRWDSVWGQETARGDPPPPSWLARLGQSGQVLVINHESASSSDSSTVGSMGLDNNKTYLRGQNIPVDASILQERELKRQKALELQNAIKKQLEEKDQQRKKEKERKLREERLEEERIKREREKERERFEEEQRKMKEREAAKLKQAETMREVLEVAERLAKEQRNVRRKFGKSVEENVAESSGDRESIVSNENQFDESFQSARTQQNLSFTNDEQETVNENGNGNGNDINNSDISNKLNQDDFNDDLKVVQVPISKDVAIVLSGRLEDSELLDKTANLQLVNLVLTPTPRRSEIDTKNNLSVGLNTFIQYIRNSSFASDSSRISPTIVENRLLTPSKYRILNGRDFGTQTDIENDLQDFREKLEVLTIKNTSAKDRKDATNASKRDIEKSTNIGSTDEMTVKALPRSKSQPRRAIESRPQWNANRPGTRYRTQSEKDPHYQRRLRMRRRQIESSDERSRSPSPDRRKIINIKSKIRALNRPKTKIDNYEPNLSMDSLNCIVPLQIDKNGRLTIEDNKCEQNDKTILSNDHISEASNINESRNKNKNVWCGQEILSTLSTLKNGLLMKQIEWDSERCLISPAASEIF